MTTRSKPNHPAEVQEIDVFLSFHLRVKTLHFFRDEIFRQQARGVEIMDELARLRPTGDMLHDAQERAALEDLLEDAFESYGAALDRFGWETDQ